MIVQSRNLRAYFNRRGTAPWSVDSGPGTEEFQTRNIWFRASSGVLIFNPAAGDDESTPTAWISFDGLCVATINDLGIEIRSLS